MNADSDQPPTHCDQISWIMILTSVIFVIFFKRKEKRKVSFNRNQMMDFDWYGFDTKTLIDRVRLVE